MNLLGRNGGYPRAPLLPLLAADIDCVRVRSGEAAANARARLIHAPHGCWGSGATRRAPCHATFAVPRKEERRVKITDVVALQLRIANIENVFDGTQDVLIVQVADRSPGSPAWRGRLVVICSPGHHRCAAFRRRTPRPPLDRDRHEPARHPHSLECDVRGHGVVRPPRRGHSRDGRHRRRAVGHRRQGCRPAAIPRARRRRRAADSRLRQRSLGRYRCGDRTARARLQTARIPGSEVRVRSDRHERSNAIVEMVAAARAGARRRRRPLRRCRAKMAGRARPSSGPPHSRTTASAGSRSRFIPTISPAMRTLTPRTQIPIAGAETEETIAQFTAYLDAGLKVVQPDLGRVGSDPSARDLGPRAPLRRPLRAALLRIRHQHHGLDSLDGGDRRHAYRVPDAQQSALP